MYQRFGSMPVTRPKASILASKALTEAQKGYVVIESLAVAWSMEKFHHCLYANYFILETDHKLLEVILSKAPTKPPQGCRGS